jgi:nitrogen fixation/metabolism regulation signal transduction histidine kinase
MDLFANSREAAAEKQIGQLSIRVRVGETMGPSTRPAWLEVVDNAGGIPPDDLEKVTTRYYTSRKKKGRGLGLPIVRKVAEAHGGSFEINNIQSDLGFGVRVRLEFPIMGGAEYAKSTFG